MIKHNVQQQSLEWMMLHLGLPTASQFDNILTPKFARRDGKMVQSYLAKKLAEKWQQSPLPSFSSAQTELGNILETEAIPWYEYEFNTKIDRVGFITTDDGRTGCSPDGLIGDKSGIEIKCPNADTHVKYLLNGGVPEEYLHQVHGCLYVTNCEEWKFLSYRRHFPPLLVTVARDDKIIEAIDEALVLFLGMFDRSMEYLIELNGGPPMLKPPQFTPGPVKFSWEGDQNDFTP